MTRGGDGGYIMTYNYDLTPDQINGKNIVFTKGRGRACPDDEGLPLFYDDVLNELFPKLRAEKQMAYGEGSKFDDRKYRLNQPTIVHGSVIIPLGLVDYHKARDDIFRSNEGNFDLQQLGVFDFGDKWAYFARTLGVAFIPITKEGSVFVGGRLSPLYTGWLNGAAGNNEFRGDPCLDHFKEQAITELRQEFGHELMLLEEPRLVGIASHAVKGDADTVWVGRIDAPDSYFLSGKWLEQRVDVEHGSNLVRINSVGDRDKLLREGKLNGQSFAGIMHSTRLGLESLMVKDFMPLM